MARATIVVAVDEPAEVLAARDWFRSYATSLNFISENDGCGCCVDIWHVEGPDAVVETIPESLRSSSNWTQQETVAGRPFTRPPAASVTPYS